MDNIVKDIENEIKEGMFNYLINNYEKVEENKLVQYIMRHRKRIVKFKNIFQGYRIRGFVAMEITNGADPLEQFRSGDTVLHRMCRLKKGKYDRKLIKWICGKCPKIKSITNEDEDTPYKLAKKMGNYDLLHILGNLLFYVILKLLKSKN